ncbi:MAG TPA: peptidoglycan DD-metalloendopeptidase family protein [Devosia sp.]|nr:peptidoglycan DD-metalloendopeptidase family protein [Devosia sp.]
MTIALGLALCAAGVSAQSGPGDAPVPAPPSAPGTPASEISAAAAAASTDAEDAARQAAANQAALDQLESSMALSKEKTDALQREIANMNGDSAKQNAALIAAGQRIKIAEIEIDSMQERLAALSDAEKQVRGRLDGADASISNMLAALERISLNPPPALIVDPSDALGSARSALLISAILPQLRAKADQVVADLKHLQDIRAESLKQQDELQANFGVLQEEQLRIATLIAARKRSLADANAQLDAAQKEAEDMGAKADSLKSLVAELTAKAKAVSDAAAATTNTGAALPQATPEEIRTALANTSRTAPAIPFATARGYLTAPASGTDVEDFGADDGEGGLAKGVSYSTKPGAQVVAPADGWVVYKGPYLNYGQIVILNPGDGYTILLAGLETVTVDVGQFLLEGQPLGTMGSRTIGRMVATGAGVSQPTLYIELRKNDQPVDPAGWWATPQNTTQSG